MGTKLFKRIKALVPRLMYCPCCGKQTMHTVSVFGRTEIYTCTVSGCGYQQSFVTK